MPEVSCLLFLYGANRCMVNRRTDMRKIRDVLNYIQGKKFSVRKTSRVTGVNRTTVAEYRERFAQSGLSWPLPADMDDAALEAALFPPVVTTALPREVIHIDFAYISEELKKDGATLASLHLEWEEQDPAAHILSYSQFCRRYRAYQRSLKISMRKTEVYGEMVYIDYSGMTINITMPDTGEIKVAQIFIGVLGGSNYTYCEATWTQRSRDWISSHVRMFAYFGGVPGAIVPDNLKSAVAKADRYFPVINETYQAMCRHYGVTPFPARPRKPKDKPRAEGAVLLAQRWILFALRKRKFFSLGETNREIWMLLERLNHKPFQKLKGSRFTRWQEHELPALQSLPVIPYEIAEWGKVRAGIDYHVLIDGHHYSVPHSLRGREFEYRMTDKAIDLIYRGRTIVLHQRSDVVEGMTTLDTHRSPAHQAVHQTDADALAWAAGIGPNTAALMRLQLDKGNGHLMAYRLTQSMKVLAKAYDNARLEEACSYALANSITSVRDIRNVLSKQIDKLFAPDTPASDSAVHEVVHENIRGAQHYGRILNPDEEPQPC
jgi:transposase